jgi:tRNA-dihydrouridine synthase B
MKIGPITLDNKTVLAPLAGITNLPFRLMAKDAGCGLVYSEMISSNGLVYGSQKTLQLLDSVPAEKPLAVQIFGSDPDTMAASAVIVASSGASILDINFGCAVKKIVKTGSGVALMKVPDTARAVLSAVRKTVRIPVTIKIRTGWTASGEEALTIARIAEDCGVDAIAVHPRTASQGFRGKADWSIIAKVKAAVKIPIIGNGDISTAADAEAMFEQTGCDAVMIGRAAIGNLWIFSQIVASLQGKSAPPIGLDQHFDLMRNYLKASIEYIGVLHACRMMRSRLGWFVKGLPHNGKFRESIKLICSEAEALERIDAYQDFLIRTSWNLENLPQRH